MRWFAENKPKKEDIKPSTNRGFSERLLMKLLVKGKGSPFKEDEKIPADDLNMKEDESKLSLT